MNFSGRRRNDVDAASMTKTDKAKHIVKKTVSGPAQKMFAAAVHRAGPVLREN